MFHNTSLHNIMFHNAILHNLMFQNTSLQIAVFQRPEYKHASIIQCPKYSLVIEK